VLINSKIEKLIELKLSRSSFDKHWKVNDICIDLADIYKISNKHINIVNKIFKSQKILKEEFLIILAEIEVNLYFHLHWHLKELKKSLIKIIKDYNMNKHLVKIEKISMTDINAMAIKMKSGLSYLKINKNYVYIFNI